MKTFICVVLFLLIAIIATHKIPDELNHESEISVNPETEHQPLFYSSVYLEIEEPVPRD